MADFNGIYSIQATSEDDSDEPIFNCAPVKKTNIAFDSLATETKGPVFGHFKDLGIRYNSRRQATLQGVQGIATGYVDQDKSGTYDPLLERATPPASPVPRRKSNALVADIDGGISALPRRISHRVGYDISIGIKFSSEAGRNYLRSITPGPYSNPSSDGEDEGSIPQVVDSIHHSPKQERKLRNRTISTRKTARREKVTGGHFSPQHPAVLPQTPTLQRKFVSCNQCRESGLRCSLKKHQQGPCSNCKKAGEGCKFVAITFTRPSIDQVQELLAYTVDDDGSGRPSSPRTNTQRLYNDYMSRKRRVSKIPKTNSSFDKPGKRETRKRGSLVTSATKPKLSGTTLGIRHITITTCFCHPIKFHYEPDPYNCHPCSWCDSPVFGLWGHSPKEVEVIPFGGDIGYEEISGGHCDDGKEQTKMCVSCTTRRIRMIACNHKIEPLEGLDPRTLNLTAVGESMMALAQGDVDGGQLIQRVRWCSICVAPAQYHCSGKSCALHLCQICADLMKKLMPGWEMSDGSGRLLDRLVALWKDDLWKRGGNGELRGDVEFLLTTGELWTRMKDGMGKSRYGDDPLKEKYKMISGSGSAKLASHNSTPSFTTLPIPNNSPQNDERAVKRSRLPISNQRQSTQLYFTSDTMKTSKNDKNQSFDNSNCRSCLPQTPPARRRVAEVVDLSTPESQSRSSIGINPLTHGSAESSTQATIVDFCNKTYSLATASLTKPFFVRKSMFHSHKLSTKATSIPRPAMIDTPSEMEGKHPLCSSSRNRANRNFSKTESIFHNSSASSSMERSSAAVAPSAAMNNQSGSKNGCTNTPEATFIWRDGKKVVKQPDIDLTGRDREAEKTRRREILESVLKRDVSSTKRRETSTGVGDRALESTIANGAPVIVISDDEESD